MVVDVLQVVGAVLLLAGYAAAQLRLLSPTGWPYLLANGLGSALLALLALLDHQWGFLLLEGVWSVVSLWGLVGLLRGRAAAGR